MMNANTTTTIARLSRFGYTVNMIAFELGLDAAEVQAVLNS